MYLKDITKNRLHGRKIEFIDGMGTCFITIELRKQGWIHINEDDCHISMGGYENIYSYRDHLFKLPVIQDLMRLVDDYINVKENSCINHDINIFT